MTNGWAGKILRVNLTKGTIKKEPTEKYFPEFLGGKGINTKVLWDEVGPEVDPFSPENRLIFGTGPLTGTLAPASSRTNITTKSPQTGIFGDTNMGGHWGPELKFSGYDHIVIYGQSDRPVYLWINNETAELRDARHIWGKDTQEATKIINDELSDPKVQVALIGPAGENKVVAATINHRLGDNGGRTGTGAIMGSKNLKAIAVRGTGDVNIAKPTEFTELCYKLLSTPNPYIEIIRGIMEANDLLYKSGGFAYGNIDPMPFPEMETDYIRLMEEFCRKYKMKDTTCFNCPIACKALFTIPEIGDVILKCEDWMNFLVRCKKIDFVYNAKANLLVQKYGLDLFSTSANIAFLMDLFEKGIITEEDTDGIRMEWGDVKAVYAMIEKIARREGCGEIFAGGITKAAQKIGRGAEKYAYHVKGLELPNYILNPPAWALGAAVTERGCLFRSFAASLAFMTTATYEKASAYAKQYTPDIIDTIGPKYEGKARQVAFFERDVCLADSLGICRWLSQWQLYGPIDQDAMAKLVSTATGKNIDKNMLSEYSDRIATTIRAFNVREGITRKGDTIPEKFFREPSFKNMYPKLDPKKFDGMLDDYYQLRGWDQNGVPTRKRLEELGLKYIADDLEKRSQN